MVKENSNKVLCLSDQFFYTSQVFFLPSLPLALSVVSTELFASHKMAEIRVSATRGAGSENCLFHL